MNKPRADMYGKHYDIQTQYPSGDAKVPLSETNALEYGEYRVCTVYPHRGMDADYFWILPLGEKPAKLSFTNYTSHNVVFDWSCDRIEWNTVLVPSNDIGAMNLPGRMRTYFRANSETEFSNAQGEFFRMQCEEAHKIGGSLATLTNVVGPYCFSRFFESSAGLVDASGLKLTECLNEWCCYRMFYKCGSLTAAPRFSDTALSPHCYDSMMQYCYKIESVELPFNMTPDTSFTTGACADMFLACTSLREVSVHTPVWNVGCTDGWLTSVAPSGVLHNYGGAHPIPAGSASGAPQGWDIVVPNGVS